jgi:hypothetical protein
MKTSLIIKIILVTLAFSSSTCFAKQKKYVSEAEFGDPKGERIVQFSGNGNLNVTGYKGDRVLISSDEKIYGEDNENENEKAKGLKKIGGGGFNIINNKKDSIIIISRPVDKNIDLDVKVPNNITLKFGSDVNRESWGNSNFVTQIISSVFKGNTNGKNNNFINDIVGNTLGGVYNGILEGDVNIKDFSGTVEVNTMQGSINAENIRGEVFASSVDGDVRVIFAELKKDRALYFSSVDGDIDLTLPKDTGADIMAKTMDGDVYSGFDGEVTVGREIDDDTATTESQNNFSKLFQSNYITTRINGGGQEIYLNTIDGNIYIRKGN